MQVLVNPELRWCALGSECTPTAVTYREDADTETT